MLQLIKTLIKGNSSQNGIKILRKCIFGLGFFRLESIFLGVSYRKDLRLNFLTRKHFRRITANCMYKNFIIQDFLKQIKFQNLLNLRRLKNYHGLRLYNYLPVKGRACSNGITARFIGSRTFEYVPRQPSKFIKKLCSYRRQKLSVKKVSEIYYFKLLHRNFNVFRKAADKSFFHFLKKTKRLGIFEKIETIREKENLKKLGNKKKWSFK